MGDRHMLPCAGFADRLVDYSDGELTADDRATVESHLARCGPCRDELRRLDASLAALRAGIAAPITIDARRRQVARTAIGIAASTTAAAIMLAIGALALKAPTTGRGDPAVAADNLQRPIDILPPGTATTGRGYAGGAITPEDALRRIALLEQQARLEASLDLMPDEPWLADQRAANERLLSIYRDAAAASELPAQSSTRSKETL